MDGRAKISMNVTERNLPVVSMQHALILLGLIIALV